MQQSEVLVAPVVHDIPVTTGSPDSVTQVKNCPWSKATVVETVCLNDVMSEELVKSMIEEGETEKSSPDENDFVIVNKEDDSADNITDCSDDHLLAQMLQLEFDKEHDDILKHEASKYNKESKVKISYDKYLRLPDTSSYSSEDEEEKDFKLEQSARNHWKNIDQAQKSFEATGRMGVCRQENVTLTKHDLAVKSRRNTGKLMETSRPCLPTGDAGTFDMKISDSVYNSLKQYAISADKRSHKLHEKKDKSTVEKTLDEKTHLILYKLTNKEVLDSLTGCIATGKEANVYHAWGGTPGNEKSKEYAIKVFKTTLNEFQNRHQYICDDYRFRYRFSKQNPRMVIHMWAEKETRNLLRMREADIPCPEVIVLKKHVLVMSFIGKSTCAAPKIKDVDLPFEDWTIMYEQVVEIMKTMYNKCKLIHADFSEFNILWHDEKAWVIDVSQAVEITHPRAMEFLLRDCTNISTFFQKKDVKDVPSPEKLFFEISARLPEEPQNNLGYPNKPHKVPVDE